MIVHSFLGWGKSLPTYFDNKPVQHNSALMIIIDRIANKIKN